MKTTFDRLKELFQCDWTTVFVGWRGLGIKGQDTIGTTGISAPVYQFRGVDSIELNQFLKQ